MKTIRHLSWHAEPSASDVFTELSNYCSLHGAEAEYYGKGEFLQTFEEEIAGYLGKDDSLFLPSGVMAQQIAIRIFADNTHCRNFAFHPTTHLEVNEHRAYSHVHDLVGIPVGERQRVILASDLDECRDPLSTLVIELPLRNRGGILPTWDELTELVQRARSRGINVHLDGARLWESAPFYKKTYAQICELFDSVYVSFYKGLGGMAGAMLLGAGSFIERARIWQRRLGGNLVTMHPYVVSAKIGFDARVPRMQQYHERALSLAKSLGTVDGIVLQPVIPQTNMFQLFVNVSSASLKKAHEQIIEEDAIALCRKIFQSEIPNWCYTEIVIGDNALQLNDAELLPLFRKLVANAVANSFPNCDIE